MDAVRDYIRARGYDALHTADNQAIIEKLARREVVYCVSGLVADLVQMSHEIAGLTDWGTAHDDAISGKGRVCVLLASGEEWEGSEESREAVAEEWRDELPDGITEDDIHALENADADGPEVYEWWIVTPWAADQLRSRGEVVMESPYGDYIWGRQTTGQAIHLDYIWAAIAAAMNILSGQSNDWSH